MDRTVNLPSPKSRVGRFYYGRFLQQDTKAGITIDKGAGGFDTFDDALAQLENTKPHAIEQTMVIVEVVREVRARTTFYNVVPK